MTLSIKNLIILVACCTANLSYAQTESMSATIIGSGSPDYSSNRVNAGVLITQGETKILLDMGDGVGRNLSQIDIEGRDLNALLFTHHHLDHNADFSPLFINSMLGRKELLIAGPSQTKELVNNNLSLYEEDLNYRLGKTNRKLNQRITNLTVNELKGGASFTIGSIKVITISVPHTIETMAYRFDYKV